MESISADLVREILLRVSATSLLASARRVCRSWRALIDDDPSFPRHQLPFSTPGYLLHYFKPSEETSIFTYISPNNNPNPREEFPSSGHVTGDCSVAQSCHGLLLMVSGEESLPVYLCNPLLEEWTQLPPDDSAPEIARDVDGNKVPCHSGFGFDASTKQYKVFRMRYHGNNVRESNLVCEVCTVGGQRPPTGWRRTAPGVGRFILRQGGILVGGRLHWLVDHHSQPSKFACPIVSLDVATESVAEFRGPSNVFVTAVFSMGGYLAVKGSQLDSKTEEIWVMKEYGKVESWTEECNAPALYLSLATLYGFKRWRLLQYSPSLISLRRRYEKKDEDDDHHKRKSSEKMDEDAVHRKRKRHDGDGC